MTPGPVDHRRAYQDARVILGIVLRLDEALLPTGGTAGEIGMFSVLSVKRLGYCLASNGHLVRGKQPPVLPLLWMADERITVQCRGWGGAHVSGRRGITSPQTRLHSWIASAQRP